jgi:hypothetical protein
MTKGLGGDTRPDNAGFRVGEPQQLGFLRAARDERHRERLEYEWKE